MLTVHIETNVVTLAGEFVKSILNVRDFTRQFKCRYYIINAGDSRPILGNWNIWPEMLCEKIFR